MPTRHFYSTYPSNSASIQCELFLSVISQKPFPLFISPSPLSSPLHPFCSDAWCLHPFSLLPIKTCLWIVWPWKNLFILPKSQLYINDTKSKAYDTDLLGFLWDENEIICDQMQVGCCCVTSRPRSHWFITTDIYSWARVSACLIQAGLRSTPCERAEATQGMFSPYWTHQSQADLCKSW